MQVKIGEAKNFREYLQTRIDKGYESLKCFANDESLCGTIRVQIHENKLMLQVYNEFEKMEV